LSDQFITVAKREIFSRPTWYGFAICYKWSFVFICKLFGSVLYKFIYVCYHYWWI